jgi:hypothetical protein
MTASAGASARIFHRRRWVLLAVIPVLLSVMVSLGYGDASTQPGSPLGTSSTDHLIAIWLVALVATVLAAFAAWTLIRRRPGAGRRSKVAIAALTSCLIVAVVVGPAVWAANALSTNAPHNDQVRAAMLAAARLCHDGTAIAAAHPYDGASHAIEIVAATADGSEADEQADVMVRAATLAPVPDRADLVQLVGCIGQSSRVTLQVCHYTAGGTYTRYGFARDVSIYAAATAELLDRQTFSGSTPDACPETKTVGDDEAEGWEIGWDDAQIWDYLGPWMNGPVRTASPSDG